MAVRNKQLEDLHFPERSLYNLFRDYSEGKLGLRRIFFRARVEAVGTVKGELESVPPSPIGSIKARVYTYGMDMNLPQEALTVFYPMFPSADLPQVNEHVYVIFEDEDYSSGLWLGKIPHFTDINFAAPESIENNPNQPTSARFEGSTSQNQQQDPAVVQERYFAPPINQQQEQTVRNFEEQAGSFWRGKKVLHIGDSQVAGPWGEFLGNYLRQNAGIVSYVRDGRTSWRVRSWLRGNFSGNDANTNKPSGPKLSELIARHNPDIVLITLGGNDSGGVTRPAARQQLQNQISQLWSEASTIQSKLWIAPPCGYRDGERLTNREEVGEVIKQAIGTVNFVESRQTTCEPAGRRDDGVHFLRNSDSIRIMTNWANQVIRVGDSS